ncbi:hypothetical protein [Azospirillum sp. TSO5]|uniref:hypothetical protein n=1 Tax=Azospirillum sp. TSO5 TaxID=716760 RepID=UPI000D607EF2|nr:hypothetical protein [Azospirillum sp. TSO5]PWC91940.1 hypothetical protein TSO5_18325 [Azospirillum sp. TSO5]
MSQIWLITAQCYLGGTSPSTNAVGIGVLTWVLAAGSPQPTWGMKLRAIKTGDPTTWVEGRVVAIDDGLVSINVVATAGSGAVTGWTFTDGTVGFSTGAYNHPTAPVFFDPAIVTTALGSSSIFGDGRTFGAASIGQAAITVGNAGGAREHLRAYGWYKRQCQILVGDDGAAFSTFQPFLTGTIEQAVADDTVVVLRFRDRLAELRRPIISDRFLGNNSGPTGVEGGDDIKGRFKQLLRGFRSNFRPVLVNEAKNIWLVSARHGHGLSWVKDGGQTITLGSQKASLAALVGFTQVFTVSGVPTTVATCAGHGYSTGQVVAISTTGVPPAGLVNYSTYYVRALSTDIFSFHPTAADAEAGTAAVNMTTTGSGTHSVYAMPAPNTVDYYLGNDAVGEGFYIRPGSRPAKGLTVEAWEGATAADRYVGSLFRRALLVDAGYTTADIVQADIDALNTAAPYESGFLAVGGGTEEDLAQPTAPDEWGAVQGAVSVKDMLDAICPDVLGWYANDQLGRFRIGQIAPPTGPAVATFRRFDGDTRAKATDINIVKLDLIATNDAARGVPLCRVAVKFAPNDTQQSEGDLLGDKTSPTDPVGGLAVREKLKRKHQLVAYPATGQDSAVIGKWGVALEATWVTNLRYAADAAAVAAALYAIYSVQRDRFKLTAKLTPSVVSAIQLGKNVAVEVARYGLDLGKFVMVMGVSFDTGAGTVTFDLWGAPT